MTPLSNSDSYHQLTITPYGVNPVGLWSTDGLRAEVVPGTGLGERTLRNFCSIMRIKALDSGSDWLRGLVKLRVSELPRVLLLNFSPGVQGVPHNDL